MRYIILLFLALPSFAHAAFLSNVELTLTPDSPSPGVPVTVTAHLRSGSEQNVAFRWFVNGEAVSQGVGDKAITVDAPAAGKETKVQVIVGTGSASEAAQIFIRPAIVTIVWEADTVTPPTYVGLPRATSGSKVTLTAISSLLTEKSILLEPKDIYYEWLVDGKPLNKLTGYGLSSISLAPPFYNNAFTVSVQATSRDQRLSAATSVRITPTTPQTLIYEETPLAGIRTEKAVVDTYPFNKQEVSFIAYPLYGIRQDELVPTWTLNGSPFTLEGDQWRAVFRKTSDGAGSFSVGLSFNHPKRFLEKARTTFLLQF